MSASSVTIAECPNCHKKFRVGSQHVGRSARCVGCQVMFVITPRSDGLPTEEVAADPIEYIGINCMTCETRYYGTQRELNLPLPCPDCGTLNVLRRRLKRDVAQRPAALDGEQYELWEGEDQPWGIELARRQSPLVRVMCDHCETITYVGPELVGSLATCADCGKQTAVRAPQAERPAGPQPVRSGDEYQLDDTWSGSLEPSTVTPVYEKLHAEVTPEERDRQIRLVATDRGSRPKLPAQPLVTGYHSFFTGPGIVIRWFTFSLMSTIAAALTLLAASMAFNGLGTILALFLVIFAFVIAVLCFAAASACAVAILAESSEGNSHIHEWPSTNPTDWMMETMVVLLALGAAGLPGGGAAFLLNVPAPVATGMSLVSIWLCFPITLLSSLEGASPFSLLMPGVLGSLFRFGPSWVQFYILSGLLLTVVAGGIALVLSISPATAISLIPVGWLGAALYFRLLGRLAWRIREE